MCCVGVWCGVLCCVYWCRRSVVCDVLVLCGVCCVGVVSFVLGCVVGVFVVCCGCSVGVMFFCVGVCYCVL